jgi:phytoene dehydrogenase-like protein
VANQYDVLIIGAGIGGLSCGNYLAKAGKKVLIIEQHYKVGGYCSSFDRKGYRFDVGVHSLGSMRPCGHFYRVLKELELEIETVRPEITNYLRCPGYEIPIYKDFARTIDSLKSFFPTEQAGLDAFFARMEQSFASVFPILRDKTFKDVIDATFQSLPLRYIFSLLLGNLGSISSSISALAALGMFREFIADGGYYPKNGMQAVADAFANNFKKLGGEIVLNARVAQILIENGRPHGVRCTDGTYIPSPIIVSNAAAIHTFRDLLSEANLPSQYLEELSRLAYTTSALLVYLGIAKDMKRFITPHCTQWMFKKLDLIYQSYPFAKGGFDDFVVCYTPSFHIPGLAPLGKDCIILITGAPFQPVASVDAETYWRENKELYGNKLIHFFEEYFGDVQDAIEVKEVASPYTLYRYTANTEGSIYGWTATTKQFGPQRLSPETPVKGLYLVGQWTRPGPGVSMVAQSGRLISKMILAQ